MKENSKFRSSTLWITISLILINPIAWTVETLLNNFRINQLVEQGFTPEQLQNLMSTIIIDLPLEALATGLVTTAGLYVGGQKGKTISYNTGKPAGQGISESSPDLK